MDFGGAPAYGDHAGQVSTDEHLGAAGSQDVEADKRSLDLASLALYGTRLRLGRSPDVPTAHASSLHEAIVQSFEFEDRVHPPGAA